MYHSAECGNLELTLDLRNLGVSWTPYTWMQTLRLAHDGQAVVVINELLQVSKETSTSSPGNGISPGTDHGG